MLFIRIGVRRIGDLVPGLLCNLKNEVLESNRLVQFIFFFLDRHMLVVSIVSFY